ncbi:ThuA domain-containing protein [Gilvimarinus sp. SDUM040013]|uniref:ThuA domain-containing protein n=1 Tax=Gilvimarinus gilvus TaxID=3058038 RepID=A0ABU4RX40_9GAMM|nr:ThuA domain-containing protein [Gilvimarinus sp. SDUM040013]MDO3387903.1 ThuA domain-containing protein [Gilvimarinus sp. SDUM040013]MDX6848726.1 ThuA domain-containing protein [Gilvimarinus sp. SDUM040013]
MIISARRLLLISTAALMSLLITSCAKPDNSETTQASKPTAGELSSVLIFSKTADWSHDSIPAGIEAVSGLVTELGLQPVASVDAGLFNDETLQEMAAIVFVNTTGDILNDQQQLAMERYIQAGGGFVGIHSATDTEHKGGKWPWYQRLVGAAFASHPGDPSNVQRARIRVVDAHHPATESLPAEFDFIDEWYDFKSLSDRRKDLLTVDERSYPGGKHGDYHPIAWYNNFDGGRSFYTGLGHTAETFSHPVFLQHLKGGLQYAVAERQPLNYALAKPDPRKFKRNILVDNLVEPISFDVLPDNSAAMIGQREGKLLWLDIATQELQTMAEFDVFTPKKKSEFGLVAVAFDPSFLQNQIIYAMYNLADAAGEHDLLQRLSQFKVTDKSVDMASEQVLIDIPNDNTCCHTGGNLEFDRHGNLFVALGDNSNPFVSNDSGPMNNKPDGTHHDALRSSANSQDLRGKILRITPDREGGYAIPTGNLFASADDGRAEIYVMGTRNPYTIAIDDATDTLYYGDVGPDAKADTEEFGPRGYDEINKVTKPGFFGWPTMVGNNFPYRMYDYEAGESGKLFDPLAAENFSPRNTGLKTLPPAQPALIWYPYGGSERFPELGKGGRNALVAGVYPQGEGLAYPDYYQGKLIIGDFMRSWIKVVTLDEFDQVVKIEDLAPSVQFAGPLDMKITDDGRLWVLEYGTQWWGSSADTKLSFIEFDENAELSVSEESASSQAGGTGHEEQMAIADGRDAAQATACIACHKERDASVGPSFWEIKNKYRSLEDPKAYIAKTIAEGSSGKWGQHVMPAHNFLDQTTRENLASYILSVAQE